jgi:hypothetical protein
MSLIKETTIDDILKNKKKLNNSKISYGIFAFSLSVIPFTYQFFLSRFIFEFFFSSAKQETIAYFFKIEGQIVGYFLICYLISIVTAIISLVKKEGKFVYSVISLLISGGVLLFIFFMVFFVGFQE